MKTHFWALPWLCLCLVFFVGLSACTVSGRNISGPDDGERYYKITGEVSSGFNGDELRKAFFAEDSSDSVLVEGRRKVVVLIRAVNHADFLRLKHRVINMGVMITDVKLVFD